MFSPSDHFMHTADEAEKRYSNANAFVAQEHNNNDGDKVIDCEELERELDVHTFFDESVARFDDTGNEFISSRASIIQSVNVGEDAQNFSVTGLGMLVPNPKFVSIQHQYFDFKRSLQLNERARNQARTWISEAEQIPTNGILNDLGLRTRLEVTDGEINEVLANGSFVRKPPAVAAERNAYFKRLFADILGGLAVENLRTTLLTEEDIKEGAAEDHVVAVNNVVDGVTGSFLTALNVVDFSEAEITSEELHNVYTAPFGHLNDIITHRRESNADVLPFGAESDEDKKAQELYNAETVYANRTKEMRPVNSWPRTDIQPVNGNSWFDEWVAFNTGGFGLKLTEEELAHIAVYANELVSGSVNFNAASLPTAIARSASLSSDVDVLNRYVNVVLESIRLQALISGVGAAGVGNLQNKTPEDIDRLRVMQRVRMRSGEPSEQLLQIQRVRVLMEANAVLAQVNAHIDDISYKMRNTRPTKEVSLVDERHVDSQKPFILSARVKPTNTVENQPPLKSDAITYEFRWFFSPGGSNRETRLRTKIKAPNEDPVDTLVVNDPKSSGENAYGGGSQAGTYRAEVLRITAEPQPLGVPGIPNITTLHSRIARLHVYAHCARCEDAKMYVGYGVPRVFGECEWRSKPMNAERVAYRTSAQFSPYYSLLDEGGGGGGSGNGFGLRHEYDDSVVDAKSGEIIVDDAGLLALSVRGNDALKNSYFTYEAVVRNISNRMLSVYTRLYGVQGALVANEIYSQRLNVPKNIGAFVGAIYCLLDPPPVALVKRASAKLDVVEEHLASAEANYKRARLFNVGNPARLRSTAIILKKAQEESKRTETFRAQVLDPLLRANKRRADILRELTRVSNAEKAASEALIGEHSRLAALETRKNLQRRDQELFNNFVVSPMLSNETNKDLHHISMMAGTLAMRDASAEDIRIFTRNVRANWGHPTLRESSQILPTGVSSNAAQIDAGFDPNTFIIDDRVLSAANAVSVARTLEQLPVAAVLAATIGNSSLTIGLRSVITRSERRFLGTLASRFGTFSDLFRSTSPNSAAIDTQVRAQLDRKRRKRTLIGSINFVDSSATRLGFPVEEYRRESTRLANISLAGLSATDVRTDQVWSSARERSMYLTSMNAYSMFWDEVGEKRLQERIAAASTRTSIETRAQKYINDTTVNERETAERELSLAAGLSKPFGVPTSLWLHMGDIAVRNGVSVTADVARGITRVGGMENAMKIGDWRGIHSERNTQPTPYNVVFSRDDSSVRLFGRGSERLAAGYDFRGLHQHIIYLIEKYNRNEQARTPENKTKILRLTTYFNVLALYAPKRRLGSVLRVNKIVSALDKIFK